RNDLKLAEKEAEFKERERKSHLSMISDIEKRVEDWERSNKSSIRALEEQYAKSSEVDAEYELSLLEAIRELSEEFNLISTKINYLNNEKRLLNNELFQLQYELSGISKGSCPYCKQEYHSEKEHKDTLREAISELSKSLESMEIEISKEIEKEDVISENLRTLRSASKGISENSLRNLKSELDNIKTSIDNLKNETNPFISQLEDISKEEIKEVDYGKINN